MTTTKMYLTSAEAKAQGLGTPQEQIERYNAALPKRGFVRLPTQQDAEAYLMNLDGYSGETRKLEDGHWGVSFRLAGTMEEEVAMKTYRNVHFTKRDYECTNLVACRTESAMNSNWAPCDESVLSGLTKLEIRHQNGTTVEYWGYL
jgi:hypothetical protein